MFCADLGDLDSRHPVISMAFTAVQSFSILSRAFLLNLGGSRLCSGMSGSTNQNNGDRTNKTISITNTKPALKRNKCTVRKRKWFYHCLVY